MKFIVAGFGQFGQLALDRIQDTFPSPEFVIIDTDPDTLNKVPEGHTCILADAVLFLCKSRDLVEDDIVLPMVPFNLVAECALRFKVELSKASLPDEIEKLLPNPFRMDDHTIFFSQAEFKCPDDCPEGEKCTVTGEYRLPLYEYLEKQDFGRAKLKLMQSFQVTPGVGGFRFGELMQLIDGIEGGLNLVGSSCKCHAVLTAVMKQ
jgi:hypothetical protein